jgi:hypothetical protein
MSKDDKTHNPPPLFKNSTEIELEFLEFELALIRSIIQDFSADLNFLQMDYLSKQAINVGTKINDLKKNIT